MIAPGGWRLSGEKQTFIKQEFQQRVGLDPANGGLLIDDEIHLHPGIRQLFFSVSEAY